jgi:oligosaccharide repeat unit polymerase
LTSVIFGKALSLGGIRSQFSERNAIKFQVQCIKLWYCIFILEVIFSGGAPVVWGAGRGYGDFGIPTLHGFSNMLRAMILAHFVLFHYLNFQMSRRIVVLSTLPLMIALFVEESRGAFVMTGCFTLAALILFLRPSTGKVLITLLLVPVLVVTLSVFQFLRNAESPLEELVSISDSVSSYESAYETLVLPVVNYIAIPALNAGLTIDSAPLASFKMNSTIMPLVPSPIRPFFWNMTPGEKDYGSLVHAAFNTSTFITPFVNDFGVVGSGIVFSWFFFFTLYTYHKARRGSVVNIVRLPPLIMCIALSFFTSYVTSLVTILYVILAGPIARRMMHRRYPK